MKKMNRIFSFLIAAVMLFTTFGTASAAALPDGSEDSMNTVETFQVSDTVQLEMRFSTQPGAQAAENVQSAQSADTDSGSPFEIKQIENGEVVQIVSGTVGGEYLTVTNYKDGLVTSVESIRVADRVKKTDGDTVQETGVGSVNAGATGGNGILGFGPGHNEDDFGGDGSTPLGTITYNAQGNTSSTGAYVEEQVLVYSELTNEEDGTYTIFAGVNDTEAIIVGILLDVAGSLIGGVDLCRILATAILSYVKHVAVGIATGQYDVELTVRVYSYTMRAFPTSSSNSSVYYGVERHVTMPGPHYDEWYYEGYTPGNWTGGDDMALDLWKDFFNAPYPGVKSYS